MLHVLNEKAAPTEHAAPAVPADDKPRVEAEHKAFGNAQPFPRSIV